MISAGSKAQRLRLPLADKRLAMPALLFPPSLLEVKRQVVDVGQTCAVLVTPDNHLVGLYRFLLVPAYL